ncbi:uncharacterized protein [Pyrus communis]|uniref:uncharacterized protein n=1 Tax=Pyrus communis TaxID=23211 RepID=UPI0035C0EC59
MAQLRAGKSSKSKLTIVKFKTSESVDGWEVCHGTSFQDVVASRGLTFRMWLLLCMMEERMPSSNAFSPEMLFPPDMFSPGEFMLNCQKSFHQRKVDDAIWAGKKLMHSWNNLSSTRSFRRFKRGFGILQL